MKNIFMTSLLGIVLYSCTLNRSLPADNNGKPMLLGVHTEADLRKKPFNSWFNKNYDTYQFDTATAKEIKPLLSNKQVEIFMGTWCGDSQREVPRMLKILSYCGIPTGRIKIIMVDNHDSTYKQSPGHEERALNIHRVPDLLVYENNIELGRIVEEPIITLEKDLLTILKREDYPTSYKGIDYLIKQFRLYGTLGVERDTANTILALQKLLKNKYELSPYARINLNAGDTAKALLIYRLNSMAYPKEADLYYRLGSVYLSMGNKLMARENLIKALALRPDYPDAKKKLSQISN